MQYIEAVPFVGDDTIGFGNLPGSAQNRCAIRACQCSHTDDDHRAFCLFQLCRKFIFARQHIIQQRGFIAQPLCGIGQVCIVANYRHRHLRCQPIASDSRIQYSGFRPRIATDNQQRVSIIDAGYCAIEQIARSRTPNFCPILTAI